MLTNTSCTLYRYNGRSYDRLFVEKVYWQESQEKKILTSGMNTVNGTSVFFFGNIFPTTATKDILVKGACPFCFTSNPSQKEASEEMKQFREKYKFVVVMTIDDYRFGSLPHVEVSAR